MVQFNSVLFGVLTVTGGNMGLKFVGLNGFNKLVWGSNPSKSIFYILRLQILVIVTAENFNSARDKTNAVITIVCVLWKCAGSRCQNLK